MKHWMRGVALIVGCLVVFSAPAAGKRIALVVGITDYPGADRLDAAVLDARLISRQLRDIGFEVTESTNAGYRQLTEDLAGFADDAADAEVALFYYAGHGFEVAGENFLMPTDIGKSMADIDKATVRMRGLPLSNVLREVGASNPTAFVVVIDACRDSPSRGAKGKGMAMPEVGDGTFIAFSTRPGERAIDSAASLGHSRRNSPFALYFAENLSQPDLGLLSLMEATQSQVDSFTQGRQRPWFSSALNGPVVLHTPAPAAASPFAALMGSAARPGGSPRNAGSPFACPPERAEAARLWNSEMRAVELDALDLTREKLDRLHARADADEARAKTALGLAYERGGLVARDRARAVRYWRDAAEDGYAVAQTLLGEVLFEDHATARELNAARKWLERASNAGFSRASLNLVSLQDDRQAAASTLLSAFCQGVQGSNP